jgi:ABC-type Zn uptake system ZnuABC Zn-binding protein ZnuA
LLPDQADRLNANYESYKKQLEEMQAYMHAAILTIPESQRVLITSHDAFQYYGREYGLTLEAIMGISTESEAQTSDIMRVNRIIDERNVPALFVESTINPKLMQQIAADKKVKIGGKLFADSLADPSLPAGTYLGMLKHNTDTIVDALKEKRVVTTEEEKGINWLAILGLGGLMLVALLIVLKRIS